jgi:hypothetical protein
MSGFCSTLKIAGLNFKCKAVAISHSNQGRTNFTVARNDPTDNTHVISFSGAGGQRQRDLYDLSIDRMLLSSRTGQNSTASLCRSSNHRRGLANSLGIWLQDKSLLSPAAQPTALAKAMNSSSKLTEPVAVRKVNVHFPIPHGHTLRLA